MTGNIFFYVIAMLLVFPLHLCADNVSVYNLVISSDIKVTINEKHIKSEQKQDKLPNGDILFGTATLPKTYVSKIMFNIKDKSYKLDSSYMYNAWGQRPLEVPGVIRYLDAHCYNVNNCTIRGLFSDAAGAFVTEWKIIEGESIRTVISDSGDLVAMFSKNITPPVYK